MCLSATTIGTQHFLMTLRAWVEDLIKHFNSFHQFRMDHSKCNIRINWEYSKYYFRMSSICIKPFALGKMSIDLPCPTTLTFRKFKIRFRWFKNTVSRAVGSSTKMRYTFNGFGRDGLFVTFPLGRNQYFIYKLKLPSKWIFVLVRWPLESQNNAQIMNLPCTHDLLKNLPICRQRETT